MNDKAFVLEKNKKSLMEEIKKGFTDASTRQALEIEEEKWWLLDNCANPEIVGIVQELTVIALHVLDAVGRLQPVNSITISQKAGIPKGTVSKAIRKLDSKNLIDKVPLPNNKKEALLYVSPLGKELFELHQILHQQFNSGIDIFLQRYEVEELELISRFLKEFTEFSWTDKKI